MLSASTVLCDDASECPTIKSVNPSPKKALTYLLTFHLQIAPADLETVLRSHPDILDAAVTAYVQTLSAYNHVCKLYQSDCFISNMYKIWFV